jgi:hypothetical protein
VIVERPFVIVYKHLERGILRPWIEQSLYEFLFVGEGHNFCLEISDFEKV